MSGDLAAIPPGHNAACLLWADPPIVLGWTGRLFRFGSASALAPLFRRRRLVFLLVAKGSVADPEEADELARDALPFVAAHPQHRFEWLCNIEEETQRLRARGLSAHTHNQNLFLREDVFRPLRRPRDFDAMANGRLSLEKRPELAALVPRVGLVCYRDPGEQSVEEFQRAWRELVRQAPGARLLNPLDGRGGHRLTPEQVNEAYARAAVGLCLSPREGAMRVAVEYQLAGLPIVGTPCRGGRDHHFDPESWLIVPPDPHAVRDAVAALQGRDLDRRAVRERALARVVRDRRRFVDFVQGIIAAERGAGRFAPRFERLLREDGLERWWPLRDFAAAVWNDLGGDEPSPRARPHRADSGRLSS